MGFKRFKKWVLNLNRKAFFVLVSAMTITYIVYRIVIGLINNTVDDANRRGMELYISAIKYAQISYEFNNGVSADNINDLDIKVITKVECKEQKIDINGNIELHGCTVDDSKAKYGYVDGKIIKE